MLGSGTGNLILTLRICINWHDIVRENFVNQLDTLIGVDFQEGQPYHNNKQFNFAKIFPLQRNRLLNR